ncbi:MAG: DUF362 domain-containing protein [Methanomicrobiales archaeon]|nr:DUF362 domain-containing protein [Methanomicrobiales archaeon]
MPAPVYFARLRARNEQESKIMKIRRLFEVAGFRDLVAPHDLTAIKIHFGERGSDSYINPVLVRQVVEAIRERGGSPFLTDTGTLYRGSRSNAVDHLTTAIEHGFAYAVVHAPLVIAGGLRGSNVAEVAIGGKHFSRVKIARDIVEADSMVVMSHFKAHMLAGFGGAIKNLAMGCAPPPGKKEQHSAHAMVHENLCDGCERCVGVCPEGAVTREGSVTRIDRDRCAGCGECMTVCAPGAIEFDWSVDIPLFVERLVEYALGAVQGKQGKVGYYNVLLNITPDCDCVPWSDAPMVPDIGILAAQDPVALDHASMDLVNSQMGIRDSALQKHHERGKDKFTGAWEHTIGYRQIEYAEEIGLGTAGYRLVEV